MLKPRAAIRMFPGGRNRPGRVAFLKRELQSELNIAWFASVFDATKIGSIADVTVWVQKLRMVKNIEELRSKLEMLRLTPRHYLLH